MVAPTVKRGGPLALEAGGRASPGRRARARVPAHNCLPASGVAPAAPLIAPGNEGLTPPAPEAVAGDAGACSSSHSDPTLGHESYSTEHPKATPAGCEDTTMRTVPRAGAQSHKNLDLNRKGPQPCCHPDTALRGPEQRTSRIVPAPRYMESLPIRTGWWAVRSGSVL